MKSNKRIKQNGSNILIVLLCIEVKTEKTPKSGNVFKDLKECKFNEALFYLFNKPG